MGSQAEVAHAVSDDERSSGSPDWQADGPARRRASPTRRAGITPAERLAQYAKLFQVTRKLASELDLAGISHQILLCAIDLIPAADAGTLYLSDGVTGRLRVQDSVGLGPSIHRLSLEPGECAAGKAFFVGRGDIYNDREAVAAALAGASEDNLEAFRQATQGMRAPKAAMSVPLIFKGDVLGALVVDKLRGGHEQFDEHDLRLLDDLAQIAAIGIMNARLFDMEHGTRLRLQVMNDELNRQRDVLDRRLRALDTMAQVAREGCSLDAVASRLASLACGRAIVLDGLGRVRAVAPADLGAASVAERVRRSDVAGLLEHVSGDRQRHTCTTGEHRLIASPVTADLDVLGFVLLELTDVAPDGLPEALVDSAALIASTVFVREQAREEGDLRRRTDLLGRLLNGDIPRTAAHFHELRPPFRLAVGSMRGGGEPGSSPGARHSGLIRQLKAVTAQTVHEQCRASAVAVRDENVVVAWSLAGARSATDKSAADKTAMFESIAEAMAPPTGWYVRFALTQVIDDPQAIPQAYREAMLALEIRPWGEDPVIDVGELGAYRLIIGATSNSDAVESSRKTLGAIIDHEKKRGGSLLPTLRTYISLGMSVTATAKALHIHVHTVQYRLAKIEELSKLSLRKSEERLTLELSLRIHDLALVSAANPGSEANPGSGERQVQYFA
jgi:GAF domain-containing protein